MVVANDDADGGRGDGFRHGKFHAADSRRRPSAEKSVGHCAGSNPEPMFRVRGDISNDEDNAAGWVPFVQRVILGPHAALIFEGPFNPQAPMSWT